MLQWLKEIYSEFTPRALKTLITGIGITGFVVYVATSSLMPAQKVFVQSSNSTKSVNVSSARIYVDVAGEVRKPGIYQLDSGARVFDVVLLAGGFTAKANQASVNLARTLTDGEQLIVANKSQQNYYSGSSNSANPLISLNQASESELEQLPGVGPALAGRMIDWRSANGGFKTKEDLLNIAGIGDKLFAQIKDKVTL
jgi:competence protein ComEA